MPTKTDVPTKTVVALAAGNGVSALLGGFGGCGLIPQTVVNIKSGGAGGQVSSWAYAGAMASFVLFLAPLVGGISQAALAGLFLTVAADTVQWGATWQLVKDAMGGGGVPIARLLAMAVATVLCTKDLAAGIIGGVLTEMVVAKGARTDTSRLRPLRVLPLRPTTSK